MMDERAREEAHLRECVELIDTHILGYEAELAELRVKTKKLYDSYRSNNPELHNDLVFSLSWQELTEQALAKHQQVRDKPYFGRIDYQEQGTEETAVLYIGKKGIMQDLATPLIVDWRAPVASVYYDGDVNAAQDDYSCGYPSVDGLRIFVRLQRKRTYEIQAAQLIDFYDSDVIANDAFLTRFLAKNKGAVLGEIIATIQKEQNEIIRCSPFHSIVVQGVAGSGKTTVAMHRISYILYNYKEKFHPEEFYVIGSNKMLLNYITGVLPSLDVASVRQKTMAEFFLDSLEAEFVPQKKKLVYTDAFSARAAGERKRAQTEGIAARTRGKRAQTEGSEVQSTDGGAAGTRMKAGLEVQSAEEGAAGARREAGLEVQSAEEGAAGARREAGIQVQSAVESAARRYKGSFAFYQDAEAFLRRLVQEQTKKEPVYFGNQLVYGEAEVQRCLEAFEAAPLQEKLELLNQRLLFRLKNALEAAELNKEVRKAALARYKDYYGKKNCKMDLWALYGEFLRAYANGAGCLDESTSGQSCEAVHAEVKKAGRLDEGASEQQHEAMRAGSNKAFHGGTAQTGAEADSEARAAIYASYVAAYERKQFDLYDLAMLVLFRRRLLFAKEFAQVRHVVVDEAQDFGVSIFGALRAAFDRASFTVMGDTSQNIYYDSGMNDWHALREQVFTPEDRFAVLAKSYRNTVEISEYAGAVLEKCSFETYKIQPVLRHGKPVQVERLSTQAERQPELSALAARTAERLRQSMADGAKTAVVVCRDGATAEEVQRLLSAYLPVRGCADGVEDLSFEDGVMVLSIDLTKGLEFDTVVLWNPTVDAYPENDGNAKLLYVACTRALHFLFVLYVGELTPLLT